MEVFLEERTLRFRRPMQTAWGELAERPILELTLVGEDGVVGRGEAAPLEGYDGVPFAMARAALEAYRPVLLQADSLGGPAVLEGCREIADLPQALAAVDIALWDRAARREGRPLCELLTDVPAPAVPVNATIGAVDRAGAAGAAFEAAQAGFTCVKVKVGVGDDAGRVAAVRAAAGPDVALRVDANGAWTVEEAIAAIAALAPAGIELVEEPVHGVAGLAEVRRAVAVRVAMDETAAEPGALMSGAADAVALKLSRAGGISGLLASAELVRATGAEPYVTSTFDGPIGIAASVHAAAALARRGRESVPSGLATLSLFEGLDGVLPVQRGAISIPDAPGLGL
ncbi:MAG TPA: enolase C-terminal domain-like protein [Solirubrobacteraceae bacterium]|nr:enolase C-terminal domain-like protein [Solirubrobacteraceae bacterium]